MKRWLMFLMLLAQPAHASGPWLLVHADSANADVISVSEYRASGLADTAHTALLRTGLIADSTITYLITSITDSTVRQDMQRMMANDEWTVVIDLVGVLNGREQAFTNVAEEGMCCPRTFFSGSVLNDGRRTVCERTGLLTHEWRHARDFIDGRAPAYFAFQSETISLTQDLDLLDYEYRGFLEQLATFSAAGCLNDNPFGRAYRRGGSRGLRQKIADVYGIYQRNPTRHQAIESACRWSPWDGDITAP